MNRDSNDFVTWLRGYLSASNDTLSKSELDLLKAELKTVVRVESESELAKYLKQIEGQ
jgi:hypothetical protein